MPIEIKGKFIDQEMTTDNELATAVDFLQQQINNANANSGFPCLVFVKDKMDFPPEINGVITLGENINYFLVGTVDLLGARLVASNNTVIIGGSSENCFLKSTGLDANTALISSNYSLPLRNFSFTHGTAVNLDATGNPTAALDWFGVNFTNCANVGTIKSYSNFIMSDCALLSSANMIFDGTIGTVGFVNCLFSGIAGQTTLNFPSTLTITRRIRAIYSSFVAFGGATAIFVSPSASVPIEAYVLDTINFSGGSLPYTGGLDYTSNTAFFSNCKGIINSSAIAQMHFNNNATATVVGGANNFVKISGTTIPNSINQKFTHTNNRLTYSGGINRSFKIGAVCSVSANNGQIISVRIAKNGVPLDDSEAQATISANGRFENLKCQTIIEMTTNDYVELFLANSANTNVTAQELNVIIEALN
ncbi:MAG: hypothetical protein VKL41_04925 [Snowella sp.]|nr:hypothetical protein [Snowella sp.]